jgi:endonuclease YncB( thermonuclease family)
VLQLNFKVGSRFVHCDRQWTNDDRSITAICTIDGEDLGAWMISQGWAVALPDAPFEYEVLERIARSRQLGVWGFPVDRIEKRRRR